MPYKHKRDCPVCDKPGLRYMSNHLRQVHHLYGDERKKWLGRDRFSISHKHCSGSLPGCPTHTVEEMRCVRKKRHISVRHPTLICTTANKSRAESNNIHGNQTMSGIQLPPQILTFSCGSHTKWENVFCPTNFGKQSYRV